MVIEKKVFEYDNGRIIPNLNNIKFQFSLSFMDSPIPKELNGKINDDLFSNNFKEHEGKMKVFSASNDSKDCQKVENNKNEQSNNQQTGKNSG